MNHIFKVLTIAALTICGLLVIEEAGVAFMIPPNALSEPTEITIDHRRGQIFRMPYKRDEDHFQFCHQFVTEIGNNLPIWNTAPTDSVVEVDGD